MCYKIEEILGPADPLVATIHHWTKLASRWSKADPSLAKLFAKPGWVQPIRLYLRQFLRIEPLRTDAVMAQARLYFPDFTVAEVIYSQPYDLSATPSKPQKEFLCRLIFDLCWVDPEACDLMVAASIQQAREWGCVRSFERLMVQERKATPAVVKFLKAQAPHLLAEAQGNGCISIFGPTSLPAAVPTPPPPSDLSTTPTTKSGS